jgi:formamidopyrimidine-DNA glycosylase
LLATPPINATSATIDGMSQRERERVARDIDLDMAFHPVVAVQSVMARAMEKPSQSSFLRGVHKNMNSPGKFKDQFTVLTTKKLNSRCCAALISEQLAF